MKHRFTSALAAFLLLAAPVAHAQVVSGGGGGVPSCSGGQFVKGPGTCATPAGAGSVTGPVSSTAANVPQYADTTGTLLTTGLPVATTIPATKSLVATNASNLIDTTLVPPPTASTLGGIESFTAITHQWLRAISTAGVPSASQPDCPDLLTASTGCSTTVGTIATQNANNVAITGGSATGFSTPINPADVAIKSYVDTSVTTSTIWHAAISYATAAVLPNTPAYNNGASGVGATLTDGTAGSVLSVDGQVGANVLNTRILVMNQASAFQNGIYKVTTAGVAGTVPWVLTRVTDFNTAAAGNIALGAAATVIVGGTVNVAASAFVLGAPTTTPITVGVTGLFFAQNAAGSLTTASLPLTAAANNVAFQNLPATSVPANTTGGSATPSGSIAYGTSGANVLLETGAGSTILASALPNPSATTLGGVQSLAAVTSKWVNTISTAGVPSATQPAFTDISGQATLAQLPSIANLTALGNVSGGSAVPTALSTAQLTTLCNTFTSALPGCAPLSGGGTANFLRADGAWASPPTGASGFGSGVVSASYVWQANNTWGQPYSPNAQKGINATGGAWLNLAALSAPNLAAVIADYRTLGVSWVRYEMDMDIISPTCATAGSGMTWGNNDAVITALRSAGINVLALLNRASGCANGSGPNTQGPTTSPNRIAWANFASAVASRYGTHGSVVAGGISAYEVWNEPNCATFWTGTVGADPTSYEALMVSAYAALKSADATATVVTAGLAQCTTGGAGSTSTQDARLFLANLYAAGLKGNADAIGDHPYCNSPVGPIGCDNIRKAYDPTYSSATGTGATCLAAASPTTCTFLNIIAEYGDNPRQIWFTEWGEGTGQATQAFTQTQQAIDLTALYVLAFNARGTWAGPVFWYNYQDFVTASGTGSDGLTQCTTVNDPTFSSPLCQGLELRSATGVGATKLSWAAYQAAPFPPTGTAIASAISSSTALNSLTGQTFPLTGSGYTVTLPAIAAGSASLVAQAGAGPINICPANSTAAFDANSGAALVPNICSSGQPGIVLWNGLSAQVASEVSGKYLATVATPQSAAVNAQAYFVSPTGNDANPCSLFAPCLTPTHALGLIVAGGTTWPIRTIYLRAGTYDYTNASTVGNCNTDTVATSAVGFNIANTGNAVYSNITISYYPPDGLGSAIINGGSTSGTQKLGVGFCMYDVSNDKVIGLSFTNWSLMGIFLVGFNSDSGDLFEWNSFINTWSHDSTQVGNGNTAPINVVGNFPGVTISNNYIYNASENGIGLTSPSSGTNNNSGAVISNNVVEDVCVSISGGDCGALYVAQFTVAGCNMGTPTAITVQNNYVDNLAGSGGSIGMYSDGGNCNTNWLGNVVIGVGNANFAQCAHQNSGNNVIFRFNVCDLTTTTSGAFIIEYQYFSINAMTGNVFSNNMIVCKSATSPCGAGYLGASAPPNPMVIANNGYHNYGAGTGGVGGVNNANSGAIGTPTGDTSIASPGITCWNTLVSPTGGLATNATVAFPALGYAWGPPGLVGPSQSGTIPSWGPTC